MSRLPHQLHDSDTAAPLTVDPGALDTLIGASPAIRAARDQMERPLRTDASSRCSDPRVSGSV